MHYLIDADSMIFKAGCSNESRWYDVCTGGFPVKTFQYKADAVQFVEENDITDVTYEKGKAAGPLAHSIGNVKRIYEQAMDNVNSTGSTLFIGGKGNFRDDIYPQYKGHRDPMSRPIHEKEIREYLLGRGAIVVNKEEVDDRVSWLQCAAERETTSIVSVDKDLNNTAGWHYNYDNNVEYLITPAEADLNFWRQMVTGDRTDNIPGIKGCGKVRAATMLPEELPYPDMEEIVWEAYQAAGHDVDYFTLQGRLLWMRRKQNEMWTPSEYILTQTKE